MARRSSQPATILVIVLAIAAFLLLRYFRKPPPPEFTCGVHRFTPAWVVRVEGVGFFDIFHQQIGVAENCMELHPLLKVEFVCQVSPEFPLPHRIEPPAEHRCGHLDRNGRFADEE